MSLLRIQKKENCFDDKYTDKVSIPQYKITTRKKPFTQELYNSVKVSELIKDIDNSLVTDEEKRFLKLAAYRHCVFNYDRIAEYYAHSGKEMQELMEQSALVIVDINDAIMNGYVRASKKIDDLIKTSSRRKKDEL